MNARRSGRRARPSRTSGLLLLLHLGLAGACSPSGPGQPPPVPTSGSLEIVWVGDVLQADGSLPVLEANGYGYSFERVEPLLRGDFIIGNAEGPITARREKYYENQRWSYNADPRAAEALALAGFSALGLANNHIYDRGPEGITDSLAHLAASGLSTFGAGRNAEQASEPLLIEGIAGPVAVLGFTLPWQDGAEAGPDRPGAQVATEESIAAGHRRALERGARFVVGYIHWGHNYAPVDAHQRRLAAAFAAAGYHLVVGHHAHVPQEVDVVDGMPVLYSLGNFSFGSLGRFTDEYPGRGLVARSYFGERGLQALTLECVETDNHVVKFQTRACPAEMTGEVMAQLGPWVVQQDGKGHVLVPR